MLIFVGLGLHNHDDLTLSGLNWIKKGDVIYLDSYTSILPGFSVKKLEKLTGKKIFPLKRKNLEGEGSLNILNEAKKKNVILLVPGDPFIATTHIQLRLDAISKGIKTIIIHAPSIISAIPGETGLFNYKFGKTVTVTFPYNNYVSETPYNVIKENKDRGLHTLLLLDINVEENKFMSINDALKILINLERKRKEDVITLDTLVVGVARLTADDALIKAGYLKDIININFGGPPHALIIPGRLHFKEIEALNRITNIKIKSPK